MKKNLPRIYFLIEGKKREFDSRVYFATKAASLGFSVVITKKSSLFDNRKYLQKGLVILKSVGPKNIKQINEYRELGYMIGAIDEEGMSFFSDKHYREARYIENLNIVDIFFSWGNREYNAIIGHYPEFKDKVYITGNQRIDVLKQNLKAKYTNRAKIIKKKYGDFILFNTMFTMANHKMSQSKEKTNLSIIDGLIKRGWSAKSDYVKIFEKYIAFQHENMKISIEFIKKFPINFPNKKLIIRPHPNERVELWFDIGKNLKNVEVIFDDESTCAWIEASEYVVSSNCTTSVESFMLNKKSINLISDIGGECRFEAPKIVSSNVSNLKDLIEVVKNFNPVYEKNEKKQINKKLKKIIFNCSEDNCSAENILTILRDKFMTYPTPKKDKYTNFFYFYSFYLYYIIRFYYRKFFTKQDKALIALITQKLKRLDLKEIEETVKDYSSGLKIDERTININEIYPQVFKIESKNNL
jgi:surface carbohydrate biosynthesis protein